ncbi:MAG: DNA polymerase, partial [Candidatus Dormibacteria bacterium]
MGRKRRTFWTLDCETDPFKQGRFPFPFIFGAYEGDSGEYVEFSTADELIAFFQDRQTVVYAHNGGKFDYHYLRYAINSDEPLLVINGRLAKFRIGVCEFRDSLNIFPNTRLKDFGNKLEIDYRLMEADRRCDARVMLEIKRYLRQDCVGLWEVIRRYWDEYGKGLTQAGSSMRVWQKMSGLQAPRQTKAQHDLYRPYYYGGRVQCFERGINHTDFSVADINSAYPYAMLSAHPFSPAALFEDHLPPDGKLHQCLITLDCTSKGAFPWKATDGELFFPEDERQMRRYDITGYEFIAACDLDLVRNISIKTVYRFPLTIDFQEYIQHFFAKREYARKRGDIAGRIFGKYFMNSLYGKFGANPEKYSEFVIASNESLGEWIEKGYIRYKPWGVRHLMVRNATPEELADPDGKWRYYNVATAASVTGYVRAYLLRGIHKCAGVVYCDTDSIAARKVGSLSEGTSLGQWKNEGTFDYYAIAGKKMYAFHKTGYGQSYDSEADEEKRNWKIASKGVNFSKGMEIGGKFFSGPELITKIAQGEIIEFDPEVPTYTITRDMPVQAT